MSWFDDINGSLPGSQKATTTAAAPVATSTIPVAKVKVEPVKPEPPKREVEKKDVAQDLEPIGWSYGAMFLEANAAYTDMIVGQKGNTRGMELPCGDCIESIAEQYLR